MARKTLRSRKPPRPFLKKREISPRRGKESSALQASILALLIERGTPLTEAEIAQILHLSQPQQPVLRKTLEQMLADTLILKKGRFFASAAQAERIRARLDLTSKGFGFAVPEGEQAKSGKDIFIASNHLNGASYSDTVLVVITGVARGRREGRVLQVLHRAVTQLCGVYSRTATGGQVLPDDDRLPYLVSIPRGKELDARDGLAVVAEITDYGSERQGPTGQIVTILGEMRQVSVQIRMAIHQAGLCESFPAEVEAEADRLVPVMQCEGDRIDLRHLPHVTIDGDDARDFDDAICVEPTENGFVLYVSIADVSHYVQTGSALDMEAFRRGTSIYFPGRVLPMLPERLSNDLCSLMPQIDRPAFTALLEFDSTGRRIAQAYHKSLIRSRQRFTYTTVHRILSLHDQETRSTYADLVPMLEHAHRLSRLLSQERIKRGSLTFNLPEPVVTLNGDQVAAISLAARNQAHLLIEECMLATNEAVAESLAKAKQPVLYRIHEQPDPGKLETFTDAAKALGLRLPEAAVSPAWFAQVISQALGSPAEYIVNNLLLRTMQQARYAPENSGHFGLAAPFYLHFTSPIRRYPDLVVHRVLHAVLSKTTKQSPVPGKAAGLADAGVHLSRCERKAIDAERNVHSRCAALYLADRIGATFAGIISGVTAFGLYVTLDESFISGMVAMTSMTDDYYLHDGRRYRLIGQNKHRIYQLGDRIDVRLDHVDLLGKRLSFSLAPQEQTF